MATNRDLVTLAERYREARRIYQTGGTEDAQINAENNLTWRAAAVNVAEMVLRIIDAETPVRRTTLDNRGEEDAPFGFVYGTGDIEHKSRATYTTCDACHLFFIALDATGGWDRLSDKDYADAKRTIAEEFPAYTFSEQRDIREHLAKSPTCMTAPVS